MRRWRLLIVIGIPILLALIAVALIVLPRLTSPPVAPEVPEVKITHLPIQDVARLENALNSPDMHVQTSVMVPELASAYLAKGQPAYPKGSTVKMLQNTSVCKDGICEVKSTITEPTGVHHTFLLYLNDALGKWLIFGSYQES